MLGRSLRTVCSRATLTSLLPTAGMARQPLMAPPRAIGATRAFAFNIFDVEPETEALFKGTSKEVAEQIFLQHADGKVIRPGGPFKAACASLGQEYKELKPLENVVLEGRLFTLMDSNCDGLINREEFVEGTTMLLNPDDPQYKNLVARLKAGLVPNVDLDFSAIKKVGIIGGGVAGLQTARALSKVGIGCTIFEKSDNVGGVWRANYADFGLQVYGSLYEFPEFPYPQKPDAFPKGPAVQEYIEQYCQKFGLDKMTRFGTGVYEIQTRKDGSRGWNIVFGKKGEEQQSEEFDFVVVATGMYGWPPHIPKARNSDAFRGDLLHSQNYTDRNVAKGKDVIVVGGGKSAIDCAVAAAKGGAKSSTLVFREAHWPVPRRLLNLVPFQWGTYSRFGHFMLPTHYDVSDVAWYMHSLLTPVKWFWWRVVELMFRFQFRLSGDMLPTTRIDHDVFTGGQILNYEFRNMVKEGKIKAVKGSITSFTETGAKLVDGRELPSQLVLYGTGFKKNYDIFDRLLQNKLNLELDGLYLYRNMIPPRMPDVAFVGAEVSTFNNVLTHGLQAQWLARVLSGKFDLPTPGQMTKAIEKEAAWKRTWMPATSARASIHQLHMTKYHDRLMKDMGENHRRKGANVFAEAFAPYNARDYASIFLTNLK